MSFGDSREFYDLSKASRDQLKDIMFVRKALATNPDNVKYVPKEIYKKICKIEEAKRKLAMKNAKGAIKYKLAFLKTMRLIANGNEDALVIAPEYIKNVENIVLAAIDKFGSVQLKNAGEQLRVDEKFTLKVIKTHPEAIKYVDALLLLSPTFLKMAYQANTQITLYLPAFLRESLGRALDDKNLSYFEEELIDDNVSW